MKKKMKKTFFEREKNHRFCLSVCPEYISRDDTIPECFEAADLNNNKKNGWLESVKSEQKIAKTKTRIAIKHL